MPPKAVCLMVKVYLDSNAFISAINQEIGFSFRGLFVEAENFFFRLAQRKDILVISKHCLNEINLVLSCSKDDVLDYFEKNMVITEFCDEPKTINFSKYSKTCAHFKDSLHVAIAIHFKCDCIVTFNIKDFLNARKVIDVFTPGDY
jgi:predicted nucleic acid-binding protein